MACQALAGAASSTFRQPCSPSCLPSPPVGGIFVARWSSLPSFPSVCSYLLLSATQNSPAFWFVASGFGLSIGSARLCIALLGGSSAGFLSACQPEERAFSAVFEAFVRRKSAPSASEVGFSAPSIGSPGF